MKAVFFDRDGVLNRELGRYVVNADEFEVNDWVAPFMQVFKNAGYNFFVITNQGGIAKELYTHTDLFAIHKKLTDTLLPYNVTFTEMFYCSHHPLKSQCLCRKPDSLMLEKAIAKYGVEIEKSFLIGDTDRDISAAAKVGLAAYHVIPNHPLTNEQLQDLQGLTGVDLQTLIAK